MEKELTGRLDAPVVFAHNDLLCGNLMLNDEEGCTSLRYKYYEFTDRKSYPHRLYFAQIHQGNSTSSILSMDHTITEVLTLEVTSLHTLAMIVTTASTYPSKDEQYHFFRHYLESEKPDEVSEKVLEALYVETNTYMLASHLHWALWALIQAKMSPIDFDYLGYFFLGFNEYTKQKEKCLSLAQSYLSRSGTG